MNMKSRILEYVYEKNYHFFLDKFKSEITSSNIKEIREKELEKLFDENKEYFEKLLVQSFTGFIPKDISEPTLKIFEDHAELLQRWILWQSFVINKRALHDTKNLEKYDGMMIYLKGLFVMAETGRKTKQPKAAPITSTPEPSFIENAMAGVNEFKKEYGKKDIQTDDSQTNKD